MCDEQQNLLQDAEVSTSKNGGHESILQQPMLWLLFSLLKSYAAMLHAGNVTCSEF